MKGLVCGYLGFSPPVPIIFKAFSAHREYGHQKHLKLWMNLRWMWIWPSFTKFNHFRLIAYSMLQLWTFNVSQKKINWFFELFIFHWTTIVYNCNHWWAFKRNHTKSREYVPAIALSLLNRTYVRNLHRVNGQHSNQPQSIFKHFSSPLIAWIIHVEQNYSSRIIDGLTSRSKQIVISNFRLLRTFPATPITVTPLKYQLIYSLLFWPKWEPTPSPFHFSHSI